MNIPAVFFILFVLVLWFIIGAKGHWLIKAMTIGAALHLCLSIGLSLSGLGGWPSNDPLPNKFIVNWILVQEPDKVTGEAGTVYLWVTDISDKKDPTAMRQGWKRFFFSLSKDQDGSPRVHSAPYSKDKHKEAEDILTKIRAGKTVVGERGGAGGEGDGEGGEEGMGGDGEDGVEGEGSEGAGSFSRTNDITFHELPPTSLPDK